MALAVDRGRAESAGSSAAPPARSSGSSPSTAELNGKHVIFKDMQRAPVSGEILHADFYEVDLTEPLRVEVALRFTGKAKGVADGGILQPLERTSRSNACRSRFPNSIEVDVSDARDPRRHSCLGAEVRGQRQADFRYRLSRWSPCCRRRLRKCRSSCGGSGGRRPRSKAQQAKLAPRRAAEAAQPSSEGAQRGSAQEAGRRKEGRSAALRRQK